MVYGVPDAFAAAISAFRLVVSVAEFPVMVTVPACAGSVRATAATEPRSSAIRLCRSHRRRGAVCAMMLDCNIDPILASDAGASNN
jgi:hypothetical protein